MYLKNRQFFWLATIGLTVVIILTIISRAFGEDGLRWQLTAEAIAVGNDDIRLGGSVALPNGAGSPRLRYWHQARSPKDDFSWFETNFTTKLISNYNWFRFGMGGLQQHPQDRTHWQPESEIYLVFGYDNDLDLSDGWRLEADFDLKFFLEDFDWQYYIHRTALTYQTDSLCFGPTIYLRTDRAEDLFSYGLLLGWQEKHYSLKIERYLGDVDWRIEGYLRF